ncbi:hypothetical protein GUJ93_ZPchr0006g42678 [Zizania palustris]|uniref:Uncharacterized protein n=1 Tax=Zizania palustris TaxID=103762 RepID=A0A8J5SET1_ZIZPA|nr:hypothetical protein GUJ93_ZPchr0006g42678 [Zizania palustris]
MHIPRLPLLLKIGAAIAAGVLALIVAAGLRRDNVVASLRREIRDTVSALIANEDGSAQGKGKGEGDDEAPPPSVLITGFRAHGKSSLVNTACRALAAEEGPLLLRAEASPPGGGSDGTRKLRRVRAVLSGAEGDIGTDDAVVELLDAPPLLEAARLTRRDIDAAINESGGNPEFVVLALRCDAPTKERNAAVKRLPEISAAVREKASVVAARASFLGSRIGLDSRPIGPWPRALTGMDEGRRRAVRAKQKIRHPAGGPNGI